MTLDIRNQLFEMGNADGKNSISRLPGKIVYFSDEAGFAGDPQPRQKWVKRGSNPTQPYFGAHVRKNIVEAVHPESGDFVSLIVPHNDKEVFQAFLDTFAQEVPEQEGKEIVLVLDNASWHKAKI